MSGPVESSLRVRLLGPVSVWRGQRELDLGPPKQRTVLAVLAMDVGRPVPRSELARAVWDTPAGTADATLYAYVSRLRAALESGPHRGKAEFLVSVGSGYLLRLEPGQVDAAAFAAGVAAARKARGAGDLAGAAETFAAALRLWQGDPLAGITTAWAQAERDRLTEERLAAAAEQAEVKLGLGGHAEVTADLTRLVAAYPLREDLRRVLMLALYRSGRRAEALAVFEDASRVLAEAHGTEPGPGLRHLHEKVLTADLSLGGGSAADVPGQASSRVPGQAHSPAAAGVVPREVPGEVSAFTGRSAELAELDRLVPGGAGEGGAGQPGAAVCVVSGTAGVGKTALVVRWAHRVQARFPDGQLYVNLRGYDPDAPVAAADVLAQFLRALGIADSEIPLAEAERAARYRSAVSGRRLLVVLDNANSVEQVRPLLPGTPAAMVVITSRDSLAGLVARDGARRLELGQLPTAEAMALAWSLIGDRVAADPASAETLVAQCAWLPLALRVAAELVVSRPHTSLAELTAEFASLEDRLALLDAGGDPRGAVATVFSWSCRHLHPEAAQVFRLLGLHPGEDWDHRATAALARTSAAKASALLGVLARAHLIQHRGSGRYGMHDLLRAYATEESQRHDSGEERRAALTRLFDYYLAACAHAMDSIAPAERHRRPQDPPASAVLPVLPDQASARAWLDSELGCLVAVTAYAANHGWPGHAIRLTATVGSSYLVTDHFTEGVVIFGHALDAARACGDRAAQARTLVGLGHIHSRQGRPAQSLACLEEALVCARDAGERLMEARALGGIASAHSLQSHYQQARDSYQQALAVYQEVGDTVGQAINRANLGLVEIRQGRYRQAAAMYEQALALFRDTGHRLGEANTLHNLGEACYLRGMYERATALQQEALVLARETGSQIVEAHAGGGLGDVFRRQGRYEEALRSYREALALFAEVGDRSGEADVLNGVGETLRAAGEPDQACERHAQALAFARQSGSQRGQARALVGLGAACRLQGRSEEAASYLDQALAVYREIGDQGGEAYALNGMGEALLTAGQPALARDSHAGAHALAGETGDEYQHARAHQGLAGACAALGDPAQAARHRQLAGETFAALGIPDVPAVTAGPPVPVRVRVFGPAVSPPGESPGAPSVAPAARAPAGLRLRFGVLGALEVWDETVVRTPTAPMVRRVLALLVLRANQVVPAGVLIEELWGEDPPPSATTTVQTYVYQLRRALVRGSGTGGHAEWLSTTAPGYVLHAAPGQVDAGEFAALSEQGRALLDAGQADEAAAVLRDALGLWRGPVLANVVKGRLLAAHAVRWEEARLHALELRVLADATLGRHQALIGELRSLVTEHPLNESFHGHLIAALGHSGRRSEALAAYQSLRRILRDELGLAPGPELQRLQGALLTDGPLPKPSPARRGP